MMIGDVIVGPLAPCRFVAEISNNHNGDRDRCGRLIDAAKQAGADFVKFQCYTPDELVTLRGDGPAPAQWGIQGWTMRTLYEQARTPLEWFPKIRDHCDRVNMPWFASVFGPESLACLEAVGCPAYKLAALDFGQANLYKMVAATGKPMIRSCHAPEAPLRPDFFLYCPPGYPQDRLHLKNIRNHYKGFSYHGTDPTVLPYAVAAGARMIEAHFQLDDEPSELESNISLTPGKFEYAVLESKRVEKLLA